MANLEVTINVRRIEVTVKKAKPVEVSIDKTGPRGLSAYSLWLSAGNTGTLQDFLDSLVGDPGAPGNDGNDGDDGNDGLSAYEIWLSLGNEGTQQDFIDSLMAEGVPDEEFTIVDMTDKVIGNIPISTSDNYITGSNMASIAYTRVGRTVKGVMTIVIGDDAVWPDPDPFFPISIVGFKATDLPYLPKVYPAIAGIAPPQPGGFGLFNINDDGDEGVGDGFAVGSVTTDFGGSLGNNGIMSFFHASNNNTTQLTNLVFDGNLVGLVGRHVVLYNRFEYEAQYAVEDEPE